MNEFKVKHALGKTREEVIELLGEPDAKATGSRKYRAPPIFLYGKYEVSFEPWKSGVCDFIMNADTHKTIAKV